MIALAPPAALAVARSGVALAAAPAAPAAPGTPAANPAPATAPVPAAGSAALATPAPAPAALVTPSPAPAANPPARNHAPKPLPFDPKKLRGLSEKLLVSHHDNNYVAAVKGLNRVQEELGRVTKDTPGFLVAGLKERELQFTNSMILHEHYFANLGGSGKPEGAIVKALGEHFGSAARWEELMRATGMGLSGGSGWAVLSYNFHMGYLGIYWAGGHTNALAFGVPILVLDMFEHAYALDFGSAAAKYVDAYFDNVNWGEVNARWERAQKMAKL